jgi:hypothetical protein
LGSRIWPFLFFSGDGSQFALKRVKSARKIVAYWVNGCLHIGFNQDDHFCNNHVYQRIKNFHHSGIDLSIQYNILSWSERSFIVIGSNVEVLGTGINTIINEPNG